jgi:hypothetical protein
MTELTTDYRTTGPRDHRGLLRAVERESTELAKGAAIVTSVVIFSLARHRAIFRW